MQNAPNFRITAQLIKKLNLQPGNWQPFTISSLDLVRFKHNLLYMKTLTSALAALLLTTFWASAQDLSNISERTQPATSSPATAHDVTGFSAPNTPGPGVTTQSLKTAPNPHPDLRPKTGGIFVDGVKYGTVMISPFAPASYGMGEKYLAAPSQTYDLQHESGLAAHRDANGLKLFSIEF
jgi:hypothetical protein